MQAAIQDFTISHAHINAPYVRHVEYFDRPPVTTEQWRFIQPTSDSALTTHTQVFNFSKNSAHSKALSTHLTRSPREALELTIEIEKERIYKALERNLLEPAVASDVDAISDTVEHVYELLSKWGPAALDFHRFLLAKNPIHVAAMLRVSVDVKDLVLGWDTALAYAIDLSTSCDLDVDDVLFGLT